MKPFLVLFFALGSLTVFSQTNKECAVTLVDKAFNALGGRGRVDSIKNIQFTGYGHRNLVEQSERFEGPFIPQNFTFRGIHDVQHDLLTLNSKDELFNSEAKFLVDKEAIALSARGRTSPWIQDQTLQDEVELGPLRILETALMSNSLSCLPDSVIHGLKNKRVQFIWKGHKVKVSFNPFTFLYTSVEVQKPYRDSYLGIWGDSRKVVLYSFWDMLDNGVHYPMQKDIYFNGQLWESSLIREAKINQPLSPDSLRIPEAVKAQCLASKDIFAAQAEKMMDAKKEIAKDVWMIPGYCTGTVIKQDNGLTIIEAPYSSGYTDKLIGIAKELYPGIPIKNIVTTSDAWLHCGGIRSAANTSHVIALQQNKEVLEKILSASYRTEPDGWERRKNKKPEIQYVSSRITLGTGPNRIEIIPFHTEAGERMMMVYYPEHKLLYASDLYQPGNWQKHYTVEVVQAVEREQIDVETVYAMHSPPVKFAEIKESIRSLVEK